MKKATLSRWLCIFMTLMLCFGLSTPVLADEPFDHVCGYEMSWSYSDGVLYLTGGYMFDYEEGETPWESYRDSIYAVVCSDTTYSIGACAFKDFDSITSVDFGSGLVEIGTQAFMGCDGLTSITLPETFRIFGNESFRSCSNLREIHCEGGFPSFRWSCLFDDRLTFYYPAGSYWDVDDIAELEDTFHMEFIREDGYDPYEPASTEAPETEAPRETEEDEPEETKEKTTKPTSSASTPTAAPSVRPDPIPDAPVSSGSGGGYQATVTTRDNTDSSGRVGRTVAIICIILLVIGAIALHFLQKAIEPPKRSRGGRRRY